MMKLRTSSDLQRFKARRRQQLARKAAAGKVRLSDFTLAAANTIKRQPLNVSLVEVFENDICPD